MTSAIASSTVKVGILHSLAGPWAIGEIALKDAEMMAIAEINQSGGVLGRQIDPIVADGASEPVIFEQQARKLIEQDQVATLFGCWTSTVRKFIVPTLERLNALLWYPVQYEGLECSKSIFYTAVCPNQQIEPAVQWLLQNKGKRFYLVGSDIVFSRTASKIIRARLKQQGGTVLGEDYVPVGGRDFRQIIDNIKQTRPDVVFSTVNSDSNLGFYPQYQEAGIAAAEIPIMAVSVTEEEIQQLGVESAVGHYAAHSYFQSLKNSRNQTFVQNFKATYGADRVTCDSVESAYVQVYLWKQAVEQAQSFEVDHVRLAAYGHVMQTPGGMVRVEQNHHLWKPCRIGKVRSDGQFDLVQMNDDLIKPQPWLGMDDVKFDASTLVTDMLAEAAQAILYNCQLEQKSQELIEANDRLQKLTQRAEFFKRSLSSQIRNSLELDTILTTAVTEIRNLLQIDRCKFLWYLPHAEPACFELSHEACNREPLPNLAHYPVVQEIESLREVILRSSILQVDDVSTATQLDSTCRSRIASLGFNSLLTVVVQTRSGRLGVIVCEHIRQVRSWRDHEVELLRDVADQLAIAIDQAELYSQTRAAALQAQIQAQQLQQALYDLQATQAQLVQTEKMSSLGQLVAGIAHEINNPVSFIYGNIDHASSYTQDLLNLVTLYRQHYPNPAVEIQAQAEAIDLDFLVTDLPKILTSMRVGSERIRQIVLSLRSFSRLDEAEMKPVDLHEGIDNTLLILQNRLRTDAKSAGIQIIKRYGNLPLIDCYAGQMNQVFMNLLVNAIDALEMVGYPEADFQHSTAEHSSLAIEIQTQMCDRDWVSIRIADNGPGIPEIFQQRLFDPFFTTKPIGKGTGLGLAISHRIVIEKHQGRLYYTSSPGKGTEFFIEIPVRQAKTEENGSLIAELGERG